MREGGIVIMTEWTIVTVIAVLVELLFTVTLPAIKLIKQIQVLEDTQKNNGRMLDELEDDFEEYKKSQKQSQKKQWDAIESNEGRIIELETKFRVIESKERR